MTLRAKRIHVVLCAPTAEPPSGSRNRQAWKQRPFTACWRLIPKQGFKHHEHNTLGANCIVIDEASMMDVVLMHQLLKAIPDHAGVLIVGDVDQLPSVGPGAVLADIIGSNRITTVRLTEIFRQAKTSRSSSTPIAFTKGKCPRPGPPGKERFLLPLRRHPRSHLRQAGLRRDGTHSPAIQAASDR